VQTPRGDASRCTCQFSRQNKIKSYLSGLVGILALKVLIDKPLVEKGDEGIRVDVGRKVELAMRCVDSPFLLEFGGCLWVI